MRATVFLAVLLASVVASPLVAQGSGAGDGLRVGISLGDFGRIGVNVEIFRDTHAVDLGVGTWSFQDLSVSAEYKEYIGGGALRPFVGAGLWLIAAAPSLEGDRTGLALALRVPLGVEWEFVERHSVGAAAKLIRGLGARRSDPQDDGPVRMAPWWVPLPDAYYRFTL